MLTDLPDGFWCEIETLINTCENQVEYGPSGKKRVSDEAVVSL